MHGHQPHPVARLIVLETQRPARLLVVVQVLQKFRQPARLALRLPLLGELRQPFHVLRVVCRRALRHFQPLHQLAQNFPPRPSLQCFPLPRNKLQQFLPGPMRFGEGKLRLWPLHRVIQRPAAVFRRALCQPCQLRRVQPPRRRRQHARARDVVMRMRDQPQVRQNVPHQRMLQDRQLHNHKGNSPSDQLFHQLVAVRMLPVENREISPRSSRPA